MPRCRQAIRYVAHAMPDTLGKKRPPRGRCFLSRAGPKSPSTAGPLWHPGAGRGFSFFPYPRREKVLDVLDDVRSLLIGGQNDPRHDFPVHHRRITCNALLIRFIVLIASTMSAAEGAI